jgi:hypothetical protein
MTRAKNFLPIFRGCSPFSFFILCFLSLFCKPELLCAQTFFGAGTEALGEAGRAADVALDAHYLNPAALAFTRDSNGGMAYQMGDPTLSTPSSNTAFVITDNDPEKFVSGGVGFVNKRSSTPNNTIVDQDISIDVATKILPTIAVGLQTHRLFRMNNLQQGFTKYNVTGGIMVLPKPFLGFAIVAYDFMTDPDGDIIPVFALGAHIIIMDIMRIRMDATQPQAQNPNNGGTFNLGLELDGGSGFLFRGGGMWDTVNQKTLWSAGISWEGPRINAAYAYRSNAAIVGDNTQTFEVWLSF